MNPSTVRDKFRGCLIGGAIGDAMGAPSKRSTSSNTEMKICVARSLIDCRTFDILDQGRTLANSSADHAARQIKNWFDSGGKKGRAPSTPAPAPQEDGEGAGNGPAVKIDALALWCAALNGTGPEPLLTYAMELGLMTHGDPRASIASLAVASVIAQCVCGETALFDHAVDRVMMAESRYRWFRRDDDALSSAMMMARKHFSSADELRDNIGTDGFCLESVIFALGTFFRHPTDFRKGVLEAVNAGGDARGTASMVGAMIGANVGLSGIPKELQDGLALHKYVRTVADELADASSIPKK